jgi:thioredoxin reductase (NADPH)
MYDIIIIGCGPAGMTAAIYALRAGKKVLILEKENIGGQISSSPLVENYPGYSKISGSELSNNLYEQVLNLKGEIELEEVVKIEDNSVKKVITEDNIYEAKITDLNHTKRPLELLHTSIKNTPTLNMWVKRNGSKSKEQVPWSCLTAVQIKQIDIKVI